MEYNPKDIKYGLIAVDPLQEGEMKDVLHFCGYWSEPTKQDAELLLKELADDAEFGLTDIAHRLVILPCPADLFNEFTKDLE